MKKVEEISTINVGDVAYEVANLPENIKELVSMYNAWRQEEMDVRLQLTKTVMALEELGRRIVASIQKVESDKAAAEVGTETQPAE